MKMDKSYISVGKTYLVIQKINNNKGLVAFNFRSISKYVNTEETGEEQLSMSYNVVVKTTFQYMSPELIIPEL